jgi:DNA-directed RNA polymerase specialized sigma24 family protein
MSSDEPIQTPTPEERRAHAARVAKLDLAKLAMDLTLAARRLGAPASAQDLAQGAILRLIESDGVGWNHEQDPTGWKYLVHAVDEARKNESKKRVRRRTDVNSDVVDEAPPSSDRGPERQAATREEREWAMGELVRRLEGSELALAIVKLNRERGRLTPRELGEILGVDVRRIYTAHERILAEMARIEEARRARDKEP